ncbi:MAG: hypothetical protein FWB93_04990 [Oscillospiraceae bacterium]|nr:hypothetical protein [Oscillospiraceae bacterium]
MKATNYQRKLALFYIIFAIQLTMFLATIVFIVGFFATIPHEPYLCMPCPNDFFRGMYFISIMTLTLSFPFMIFCLIYGAVYARHAFKAISNRPPSVQLYTYLAVTTINTVFSSIAIFIVVALPLFTIFFH